MDIISWIADLAGIVGTVSDAGTLLAALGPWVLVGMAVIVFVESGVLFPFLPGDSLLVTAAVLHGSLGLGLWQIVSVCVVAAIAGDQAGYWLGSRFGRRLFKDDARILRTDRLEAAEAFFVRHGHLALVLGRFVPVVRTYVPFAAGTARMPYRRFVTWNVLGAVAWVGLMTGAGVLLSGIPGIADSIEGVMLVVIAVSMLPVIIPAARRWWERRPTGRDTGGGVIPTARTRRWGQENRDGRLGDGTTAGRHLGVGSDGARGAVADLGAGSP